MIICMATVDTQIYGRTDLALQALIIVQTIIHRCSKVSTTGQARVNPEHYVIKGMGVQ